MGNRWLAHNIHSDRYEEIETDNPIHQSDDQTDWHCTGVVSILQRPRSDGATMRNPGPFPQSPLQPLPVSLVHQLSRLTNPPQCILGYAAFPAPNNTRMHVASILPEHHAPSVTDPTARGHRVTNEVIGVNHSAEWGQSFTKTPPLPLHRHIYILLNVYAYRYIYVQIYI